jgi:outer membrane biosynthesis protein TonB
MRKVILALALVFTVSVMLGINQTNASTITRSEIQNPKPPPKPPTPPKPKGPKKPAPKHKPKPPPKPPWVK